MPSGVLSRALPFLEIKQAHAGGDHGMIYRHLHYISRSRGDGRIYYGQAFPRA